MCYVSGVSGLTETPRRAVAGTHSLCSVFSLVQLQAYLKLFGKNYVNLFYFGKVSKSLIILLLHRKKLSDGIMVRCKAAKDLPELLAVICACYVL